MKFYNLLPKGLNQYGVWSVSRENKSFILHPFRKIKSFLSNILLFPSPTLAKKQEEIMKVLLSATILVLICAQHAAAQYTRDQDIAFSTTIVRGIDLNHPSNQEIFGKKSLMCRILLEAAQSGSCKAYKPDTLEKELSYEELIRNISFPDDSNNFIQYSPQQLYEVELQEELIFDKQRSEFRFVPRYITIFIPAELNYRGIMEPVASWRYQDCMKIFKADKRAYSDSEGFGKSKIHFNETFLLRSYYSQIVKIGHGDDLYFDQMYADPLQAFLARKEEEGKLQEMIYKIFHP
jgi:hypothetical protein